MSGAIRNLLVNVGVKAHNTKDLMTIQDGIDGINDSLGRLQSMALKGAAALGVATVGILKLTRGIAADADQITNSANALGMSIEIYQGFQTALHAINLTAEQVDQTFFKMATNLEKAKDGSKEAIKPLKTLGLTLEDIKSLSPDQMFDLYASRIKNLESSTERMMVANQIWGDDLARKLMPMLVKGGEEVAVFAKIAEDAGAVMSESQAKSAARMDKTFRRMAAVVDALKKRLGLQLLPIVDSYMQKVWKWYQANKELLKQRVDKMAIKIGNAIRLAEFHFKNFLKTIEPMGGFEKVLGNVFRIFVAITALKVAFWFKSLLLGFKAVIAGITAVSAKFLALGAVVATALAGAALILEDFMVWKAGGDSFIGSMMEEFKGDERFDIFFNAIEVLEALVKTLKEVKDAVALFWKALEPGIKEMLPTFIGLLTVLAVSGLAAISLLIIGFGGLLAIIALIVYGAWIALKWLWDNTIAFFNWFEEALDAWSMDNLKTEIQAVGDAIDKYLIAPFEKAWNAAKKIPMLEGVIGGVQAFGERAGAIEMGNPLTGGMDLFKMEAAAKARNAGGSANSNQTVTVEQKFEINGAADPNAVGNEVARKQKQGAADVWKQAGSQFSTGSF